MFRITGLLEAVVLYVFLASKIKKCAVTNVSFRFQDTWTKVLITVHTETCEDLNTCRLAAVGLVLLSSCQTGWAPSH